MIRLLVTLDADPDDDDAREYASWVVGAFEDTPVPCLVERAPDDGPVFGPLVPLGAWEPAR